MDSDTSKSDEEVRQQCDNPALHEANVQQALDNADGVKDHQRSSYPYFELRVLAAEVRRLREAIDHLCGQVDDLTEQLQSMIERGGADDAKRDRLRAALYDVGKRHERAHDEADKYQLRALAAELKIVELNSKLARVEALADAFERSGNLVVVASIRKALGDDPHPSAAPTPKGEPYNGY